MRLNHIMNEAAELPAPVNREKVVKLRNGMDCVLQMKSRVNRNGELHIVIAALVGDEAAAGGNFSITPAGKFVLGPGHGDSRTIYPHNVMTLPSFRRLGIMSEIWLFLHESYPDSPIAKGVSQTDQLIALRNKLNL